MAEVRSEIRTFVANLVARHADALKDLLPVFDASFGRTHAGVELGPFITLDVAVVQQGLERDGSHAQVGTTGGHGPQVIAASCVILGEIVLGQERFPDHFQSGQRVLQGVIDPVIQMLAGDFQGQFE